MSVVRFRKIDDQNRGDHFYLGAEDECYYLHEYTAHKGFSHSPTNQLIVNLKKRRGQGGFQYKAVAIRNCAAQLSTAIRPEWLSDAVLVPTPPSKVKTDPQYDDRVAQICRAIRTPNPANVRELVNQTKSMTASHEGERHKPDELKAAYQIDESLTSNMPDKIGIVDDMVTAGAHFRAMKDVLGARFPQAKIVGFFVTRRIHPNPFEGFEELLDDV